MGIQCKIQVKFLKIHQKKKKVIKKRNDAIKVNGHDFPDPKVSKAIPYGIYDVGTRRYSKSTKLLICADAGGSNGCRLHLWKKDLQQFADAHGIEISVCHFLPGTSKWNNIGHRLFSFISLNWRGKLLISYQVIINLITATTTKTGLAVKARLDKELYPKGKKVPDDEMKSLRIAKNKFHGDWNYTIKPRKSK